MATIRCKRQSSFDSTLLSQNWCYILPFAKYFRLQGATCDNSNINKLTTNVQILNLYSLYYTSLDIKLLNKVK